MIHFTNNPWIIRPALVQEKLGVDSFRLVNDFEAVAHAVACADDDKFLHLAGPDQPLPLNGRLSVVGPGTGLGVAHLYREADASYRVSATEGGHVDFAPLDHIEDAILARLRKRHNRVSAERVVAGPAIVEIYATLASLEGRPIPELDDVAIWNAGMERTDSLAEAAIDRFCLSLGSVAGDIALAQGGFAGVVIAGGLGYRLRNHLPRSGFAERFRAKGRFENLMAGDSGQAYHPSAAGLIRCSCRLFSEPRRRRMSATAAYEQSEIERVMRMGPVIPVLVVDDVGRAHETAEALVEGD